MEKELENKMLEAILGLQSSVAEIQVVTTVTQRDMAELKARMSAMEYKQELFEQKMDNRFNGVHDRFDEIESKIDNIESEVGSMKDALLDVARTVKSHDSDIRYLKAQAS